MMKRKESIAQYESILDRLETSLHYREQALKHALAGDLVSQKPFTGRAQGERDLLKEAIRQARKNLTRAKLGLVKGDGGGTELLYLRFLERIEVKKQPVMGNDYHNGQVEFLNGLQEIQRRKMSQML